jgi:NADPH2:quinone reductase
MKEALVSSDLTVQIVDSPIPLPGPGEVLIKVKCAGCNPKDWKYPMHSGITANSGDDLAGEISSIGEGVFEFRAGDRVAAMHQMRTSGGSFAEYAIAPAVTAFHLPEHVSFEEVTSPTLRRDF